MHRLRIAILLTMALPAAILGPAEPSLAQSTSNARPNRDASEGSVVVGPNIQVSRDGNFPHFELMIAANPKNRKNLVGGVMTGSMADGGIACKTYSTFDGGYTWFDTVFPEQFANGGADPQIAFSPGGTVYFSALGDIKDEHGRTRSALHFYRSEDGGRIWSNPLDLGYSYDHPQITVDHTYGQFAGRIYIGVLYSNFSLGIFRSSDEGRTFVGPVRVLQAKGIGVNVTTLVVLSDGTLVMTYLDFPIDPARRTDEWTLATPPVFAADDRSTLYRDRLYAAWIDFQSSKPRIVSSYSADSGKTWKEPRPLDVGAPADATQFQPAIAVNKQGTVAVMWFDTRELKDDYSEYNAYFSASVDGGKSFLPAKRLSSAPSSRWSAGNITFTTSARADRSDLHRISFYSVAARWGQGGDYMGLTADSDGVFHPFWADSRTGVFQAWTSRVRVDSSSTSPRSQVTEAPQERMAVSLTNRIEIVMAPSVYHPATQELHVPISLKNVSDQPIYKPIIVEVKEFGGTGASSLILNAMNGKQQDGAKFDYSSAMRDLAALEPQGRTEAVVWRFKLTDPLRMPDMLIQITGGILQKN